MAIQKTITPRKQPACPHRERTSRRHRPADTGKARPSISRSTSKTAPIGMINTADNFARKRQASAAALTSTLPGETPCSSHQMAVTLAKKKRAAPMSVVTSRPWASMVGLKAYSVSAISPPPLPNR